MVRNVEIMWPLVPPVAQLNEEPLTSHQFLENYTPGD